MYIKYFYLNKDSNFLKNKYKKKTSIFFIKNSIKKINIFTQFNFKNYFILNLKKVKSLLKYINYFKFKTKQYKNKFIFKNLYKNIYIQKKKLIKKFKQDKKVFILFKKKKYNKQFDKRNYFFISFIKNFKIKIK
jgi:hypothetical protein